MTSGLEQSEERLLTSAVVLTWQRNTVSSYLLCTDVGVSRIVCARPSALS